MEEAGSSVEPAGLLVGPEDGPSTLQMLSNKAEVSGPPPGRVSSFLRLSFPIFT